MMDCEFIPTYKYQLNRDNPVTIYEESTTRRYAPTDTINPTYVYDTKVGDGFFH